MLIENNMARLYQMYISVHIYIQLYMNIAVLQNYEIHVNLGTKLAISFRDFYKPYHKELISCDYMTQCISFRHMSDSSLLAKTLIQD